MNMLPHIVTKILREPYQIVTDMECCWAVDVEYDCWGAIGTKTIKTTYRPDWVKKGWRWEE